MTKTKKARKAKAAPKKELSFEEFMEQKLREHTEPKKKRGPKVDGVTAIVRYLVKNKKHIGALVVVCASHAGKRIASFDGTDQCDATIASADLIGANDQEERASTTMRSIMTRGLVHAAVDRLSSSF